jgi:hypothetical protein
LEELAEIDAAIKEEREARANLGLREAFLGKGNWPRFGIAFFIFFLQQWAGQNSVNYFAPQIFASVCNTPGRGWVLLLSSTLQIGYTGRTNGLLASGIYGVMKVIATIVFIFCKPVLPFV